MPLLSADPDTFPAEPPADIHSPAAIAAHDWAAFSALDKMTDHWARPGWPDGTRAYYWLLTFPTDSDLTALAARCQAGLAPLGLDPVPGGGLHITLARVGTPNTVTPAHLDDLLRAAEPVLPAPFSVRAMPLAGSRGAVRLSLGPWEPLLHLHAALAESGRAMNLTPRKPTAVFRPHLSLAYNNRPRPAAPVIETVAGLRSLQGIETRISEVQLVELRREQRTYRWDVVKSLPLG
ncbi:2'-5' RNA ligase family protein [Streptomyces apocyni]|uniref:2'-5' RNA ligase family protein n=1 Tax=Streptomyces apocyni TaxID=2654677 RepID=UPI0012EA4DF0|nr:2'-5' RNA ligase family protein [Streptomyces apocyni]